LKPSNPKRNHTRLEEMNLAHAAAARNTKNAVVDSV
jgi:hypothetical protein